jgi:two-component system NtrC family sensor kinase
MNRKLFFTILPILALLILGGLNIYKKAVWKEPSDGVIWKQKAKGLTAIHVEKLSQAYLRGIRKGDVLYSMSIQDQRRPVRSAIDIGKVLWEAQILNQPVIYEIAREGELPTPRISIGQKGTDLLYFYLALVGLTTLVIAALVFLTSKTNPPFTLPYVFFFLVSISFYGYHIFSPTGQMDLVDTAFYWLDKLAFLVFPPLLLHFFIIFPRRKKIFRRRPASINILYLPAAVLLLAKLFIHFPNILRLSDSVIVQFYETSEKLDLLHFAVYSLIAFGVIFFDTLKVSQVVMKRQLKWIVYGLGLGLLPFTLFYIGPFLLDHTPHRVAEFTVILQALVPLTFAYSISRYRLLDIEIILRKAVPLIFSYVVIALIYFIVSSQTSIFPENQFNVLILGVLAIILGATLYTPIKKLFQALIERVIYRRSYKYRKTLLTISQELSRERDLAKLAQAILEHIAFALSLQYIALLLPVSEKPRTFFILESRGVDTTKNIRLTFDSDLFQYLQKSDYLSEDSLADKRELQKKFRGLASFHFFHLMPLRVEDKLIGCLAMGKKFDNSLLNSEDWELLMTISSPIALALENAYLYNQAHIRALELERLKDYSENIIESLTVGVVVLDQKGQIIGWNRVMEDIFRINKNEALDKNLAGVLGEKNYWALFPPDTQKDFRLLSEISIGLPTGQSKIFDIAKTPLRDNQMNPYGTIIVFEDATEKISLQQQLVTSEKLASVGLLSAGVAHEINTPLTGISSYVQILQKKLADSPHAPILDKIEVQTDRVAKIVKSLLNFARNPSETVFYQVDLREIIQGIISLIDYKLKNLNIKLEIDLGSLKPIWAQGEQLQQVFINIILNAIDAMPDGGTLGIQLAQDRNIAFVKIRDTGTGISRQHLPHIFDPFFTTKGIGKGTGLGLSISYAIIKDHEGYITVESESGKGTLFTISVPMDLDKKEQNKTLLN